MWLSVLIAAGSGAFACFRGRSATVWFFVGLVYFPVAYVLLLMLPSLRRCQYCRSKICQEEHVCPLCGKSI